MLTAATVLVVAIALLAAVFMLQQARQWRRVSERAGHEMWGKFERQIALAASSGDVRYAWAAIGCGWVALVVLIVRGAL